MIQESSEKQFGRPKKWTLLENLPTPPRENPGTNPELIANWSPSKKNLKSETEKQSKSNRENRQQRERSGTYFSWKTFTPLNEFKTITCLLSCKRRGYTWKNGPPSGCVWCILVHIGHHNHQFVHDPSLWNPVGQSYCHQLSTPLTGHGVVVLAEVFHTFLTANLKNWSINSINHAFKHISIHLPHPHKWKQVTTGGKWLETFYWLKTNCKFMFLFFDKIIANSWIYHIPMLWLLLNSIT